MSCNLCRNKKVKVCCHVCEKSICRKCIGGVLKKKAICLNCHETKKMNDRKPVTARDIWAEVAKMTDESEDDGDLVMEIENVFEEQNNTDSCDVNIDTDKRRNNKDIYINELNNSDEENDDSSEMEDEIIENSGGSVDSLFSPERMSKLRKAEKSAESSMECKQLSERKRNEIFKKRNKKITQTKLILKNDKKSAVKKVRMESLMCKYLGRKEVVQEQFYGNRKSYVYKCPECSVFISDKLSRHLCDKHNYKDNVARLLQSKMRVFYLWCQKDKHQTNLPLPCTTCNEWHLRLDKHLQKHIIHKNLTQMERKQILLDAKQFNWVSGSSNTLESTSNKNTNKFDEKSSFVIRSKPKTTNSISSNTILPSIDYLPPNAFTLTESLRTLWNIRSDDFFTIYFSNTNHLLQFFEDELKGSGHTIQNAVQHRNYVSLIWGAVSQDLDMFPINPLCNVHLFRDHYHRPTFKSIGKTDGVQAGTLRSRYTSFNFFLQFLRRNQIFAGMSRVQLNLLEQSVSDFNKELNPIIKQRKIDIRQHKLQTLILPKHFINYGQSKHVQNILSSTKSHKTNTTYSKSFAIQFRDYLITSIVIANGLRASNVIQLRERDFEAVEDVEGYEGHKVITNSTYKTSTIYGEKFIVLSEQLFQHYLFYKHNLKNLVSPLKSLYTFLPASGTSPLMSQTNVSSSLTASFRMANVLQKDYSRVSCTRIRCGLATFACNEGGFDSLFFAKHFMKNRQETTDIHYNLKSNRRHALSIAMKLYDSFNSPDGVINVSPDLITELLTNLQNKFHFVQTRLLNGFAKMTLVSQKLNCKN